MHTLTAFLALSSLICGARSTDSEGTAFVFTFGRNFEDQNQNTILSATVINNNADKIKAVFTYFPNPLNTTFTNHTMVTIQPKSALEVFLPNTLAWDFVGGGFVMEADTRVFVTTSENATIIANNFNTNGVGDSFIVLPTSFVSGSGTNAYKYAVAMPRPADSILGYAQYTIFTFIPLVADTTVTVYSNDELEPTKTLDLKFARGQRQHYYTVPAGLKKDPVIYASANKPFSILATVTCATTADQKFCDHASFMPQPVSDDYCSAQGTMHDDHMAELFTSQRYYMTPPNYGCPTFDVIGSVTSNNSQLTADRFPLDSHVATVTEFPRAEYGDLVAFESEHALVQVTRLGGFRQSTKGGVYIDLVPSITQLIILNSGFYTRYAGDRVEFFCEAMSYLLMSLDGQPISAGNPPIIYVTINGVKYYNFHIVLDKPGYHRVEASYGQYTYYIVGNPRVGSAYGYLGAFNRQVPNWVNPPPSTTPGPTTSQPASPTGPFVSVSTPVTVPVTSGPATSAGPVTSNGPVTAGPVTTVGPVTAGPVTAGPVTAGPVTAGPVTAGPVTAGPVTAGPVTAGPVTAGPVTAGPATGGPATGGPATGGTATPPTNTPLPTPAPTVPGKKENKSASGISMFVSFICMAIVYLL